MVYLIKSKKELNQLVGKIVQISASNRIMRRCRLFIDGMFFKVLGVLDNNLILEPTIDDFKHKTRCLSLDLQGIEWEITESVGCFN